MPLFVAGLLVYLVAILLALGFIRKNNRTIRNTSLILSILAGILLIILSIRIGLTDQPLSILFFKITPELQLSFVIDRLAAFFIFIISLVSVCVEIYSLKYVEESATGIKRNVFIPLMNLFILSMLLFVASDNSFSQLLFWELMSYFFLSGYVQL